MNDKRLVPAPVRALLNLDAALTDQFCITMNQYLPFRQLRTHYKLLEISCHGIPWLAGWLAFIWLANIPSLYEMQVNFYIGLLLDIVYVAVMKAFIRRRRPPANNPDMFSTFGPDVYSFPSGHASRAVFIVYFFIHLFSLPMWVWPPLFAWSTCICISRILLRRHHILDVVAGVVLGIMEGIVLGWIWLSPAVCKSLIFWLTEEQTVGSDYHV